MHLLNLANSPVCKMKCFVMQICGGDRPYIGVEMLLLQHTRCNENAIRIFNSTRKMGGPEFSQAYLDRLTTEINDLYSSFIRHNESKNIFAAAKTPAVLFFIIVVCYFTSGVFGILGLQSLSSIVNLVMLLVLVVLGAWVYARYTGEWRETGVAIDEVASSLWENVSNRCSLI